MANGGIPPEFKKWIDAKKRHRLTQAHIVMAMELGMNPGKFGSLGANPHEKWKAPLPEFIEECYYKRFKRDRPEVVLSFVQMAEPKKKAHKANSLIANGKEAEGAASVGKDNALHPPSEPELPSEREHNA